MITFTQFHNSINSIWVAEFFTQFHISINSIWVAEFHNSINSILVADFNLWYMIQYVVQVVITHIIQTYPSNIDAFTMNHKMGVWLWLTSSCTLMSYLFWGHDCLLMIECLIYSQRANQQGHRMSVDRSHIAWQGEDWTLTSGLNIEVG